MMVMDTQIEARLARMIPSGATENFWHAADGWPIRRLDWPADRASRARGRLLFMAGRGDIFEKYIETFYHWHARGWHITAMDWRGQAGSGRFSSNPHVGHAYDFGVWVDDLAAFWAEWIAGQKGPHVLVGHSMGGHLVLRTVAQKRILPDSLILSTPMLAFNAHGLPLSLQLMVARVMRALMGREHVAWESGEKPGDRPDRRMRLLTHDARRYADELYWRESCPELRMGPATWGWMVEALTSMRIMARPGLLEAVQVPVQLFNASADALVSPRATAEAGHRLPHGEVVTFGPEAAHEILREIDPVRERMLAAIDDFLDRNAPLR